VVRRLEEAAMSFAEAWREAPEPDCFRNLVQVEWDGFRAEVESPSHLFVSDFVSSISEGDIWLLKGAFEKRWCEELIWLTHSWTSITENGFHSMVDGVPDHHRIITQEIGDGYAFPQCKHSAYFFRWNGNPVWDVVTPVWRTIKTAIGLEATAYEGNLPSDGPTDRIQVVRYPPRIGFLAPHRDPHQDQRTFISAYLTKRGVHYEGGGFYVVSGRDSVHWLEEEFEVGDLAIGHARVPHGISPCDLDLEPKWGATSGRWFLGLYSNSPHTGVKRHTGEAFEMDTEGLVP
jgi:hypothetical protein